MRQNSSFDGDCEARAAQSLLWLFAPPQIVFDFIWSAM
jgi:hypothetical protein